MIDWMLVLVDVGCMVFVAKQIMGHTYFVREVQPQIDALTERAEVYSGKGERRWRTGTGYGLLNTPTASSKSSKASRTGGISSRAQNRSPIDPHELAVFAKGIRPIVDIWVV